MKTQTTAATALRSAYVAAKAGSALNQIEIHSLIKTVRGEDADCATKAHAAFVALGLYPVWEARYSNEDFDRRQALACELTDADRKAGRSAPACGYSAERIEEARLIVKAANRWS